MRQSARRRGQRGATSSAQLVVVAPVLLFLLTMIFQFVAWYEGEQVAEMAARRGADAARLQGGTLRDGATTAKRVIDRIGVGAVLGARVETTATATDVRVVVSGYAQQLIPVFRFPVRANATGPVERFNPPGGPQP